MNGQYSTKDWLHCIFDKQQNLTNKFLPIEMSNGRASSDHPVDINSREGQIVIKDFLWRITEELVEVITADSPDNIIEELSDVLHFITELCMIVGINPADVPLHPWEGGDKLTKLVNQAMPVPTQKTVILDIIVQLGEAGNLLKGKVWKKEYPHTVPHEFKEHIIGAYRLVIGLFVDRGLSASDIYDAYFHKSAINDRRLEETNNE